MPSRFDSIKYDDVSQKLHNRCKKLCLELETLIAEIGGGGAREKSIALTVLEHVYTRCGRAIRDDQLTRKGGADYQDSLVAE